MLRYAGFVFTILFILISELLPDPEKILPAVPAIITTGVVPFLIVTGTIYLFMNISEKEIFPEPFGIYTVN